MTKEQAQREVEEYVRTMPAAADFDDPNNGSEQGSPRRTALAPRNDFSEPKRRAT